jgi:hypothetical protein
MRPPVPFKWRGIHHSYMGFWFVAFGLFFLYMNWGNNLDFLNPIYWLLVIFGGLLIIDDAIEHLITENTPSRIIWNWILKKVK